MPAKPDTQAIRATLFADYEQRDEHVYAVLDGGSINNLPGHFSRLGQDILCLYRGDLDPGLASVAPYLVRLEPDSPFTEFVLSGWGQHWGIFAISPAEPEIFHRHFRRLQLVDLPGGRSVLFRYYDPRILPVFLTTCTADEHERIFGPVSEYVMEREGTHEPQRFVRDDRSRFPDEPLPWDERRAVRMLRIRPEQLSAFDEDSERRFLRRLHDSIAQTVPAAAALETDDLNACIVRAVERARARNIMWESNLADYVLMTFEYGDGFDDDAEIAMQLESSPDTVDVRFQGLRERVPLAVWDRLRLRSHTHAQGHPAEEQQ